MAFMSSSPGAQVTSRAFGESAAITRYYQTLRAHIKLIALCLLVTLAASVLYVKVASRSYTASAQMVVNPAATSDSVLFSLPVLHSTGDPTQDVLTAAGLIHTTEVAQATIAALHLHTSANSLLGRVSVVPEGQSNIISVTATAPTATQAQQIANTFAQETVAVRTAALHKALAVTIPGLRTTVAKLPPAERNGTGTLGDQLNQLEQMQNAPDPTVAVSSRATLPGSPTTPKTSLSIIAGILIGLLIGIAAAFAIDAFDPRVRREEQLRERFAGAPVLARIPRRHGRARPGPLTPMDLPAPALEQYRTLRATLTLSSDSPQAYLVTGTVPGEGKTTSAINLAVVLAQAGADVILIDADLRRPTIAEALGVRDFRGIEQVLNGETELGDALEPVRVGPSRLRVLAAHGQSGALAERWSPARADELIVAAKRLADVVVIDSPPLTSVTDALPFARVADRVLMTVRTEHTKLSKLGEAWELLGHQGTWPDGIILIGVPEPDDFAYDYGTPHDPRDWETVPGPRNPAPGKDVVQMKATTWSPKTRRR